MTAKPVADKVEAVAVELRLDRMSRLYNSLDPAPFHEKELDAAADDYIVGSAEDLGGRAMRLVIMLPRVRTGAARGQPYRRVRSATTSPCASASSIGACAPNGGAAASAW